MANIMGVTKNGVMVYDREVSHFHEEGGLTAKLLLEAIFKIRAKYGVTKATVDMGRIVGKTTCVPVTPDDNIVYVYRKNRKGETPMVIGKEPEDCRKVTAVLLRKRGEKGAKLLTAYIGNGAPREPWDRSIKSEEEQMESDTFWCSHALIFDKELVDWNRTEVAFA